MFFFGDILLYLSTLLIFYCLGNLNAMSMPEVFLGFVSVFYLMGYGCSCRDLTDVSVVVFLYNRKYILFGVIISCFVFGLIA